MKGMQALQKYAVVKLHHPEHEGTTLFLTPGAVLPAHLTSYQREGYTLFSVLLCDQEEYLNARLDKTMEDYTYESKYEEQLRDEFRRGEITLDTYMDALTLTSEYKMTCLKLLYKQVRRLQSHDYDIRNEVAIQLYDMVF